MKFLTYGRSFQAEELTCDKPRSRFAKGIRNVDHSCTALTSARCNGAWSAFCNSALLPPTSLSRTPPTSSQCGSQSYPHRTHYPRRGGLVACDSQLTCQRRTSNTRSDDHITACTTASTLVNQVVSGQRPPRTPCRVVQQQGVCVVHRRHWHADWLSVNMSTADRTTTNDVPYTHWDTRYARSTGL